MFTRRNILVVATLFALQASYCTCSTAQKPPATPPAGAAAAAAGAAQPAARSGLTGAELTRANGMLKKGEALDKVLLEKYIGHEIGKLKFRDPNDKAGKDMAGYAQVRTTLLTAIRTSSSEQAKSIASKAVLANARALIGDARSSPATRVNALLAIAELDIDSKKPNPEAFDILLSTAKDSKLHIALRVAATYGLYRHASNGAVVAAKKPALAQDMLAVFTSQPANPLERPAHAWLVRRSLDVLSSLGDAKAVLPAIDKLVDTNEQPSVRVAIVEYLSKLDLNKLPDDKKTSYFLGLSQLVEQQLVQWHKREHGRIKAKSGGGMGGGMGGMGGGMDMGGMDMGGMDMGAMGGMGSDMAMGSGMDMGGDYGGMGGGSGSTPKTKAIDVQPWDVRLSRRYLNHMAQVAHLALDGRPVKATTRSVAGTAAKGLINQGLPAELQEKAKEMVEAVELFQLRINSSTNVSKLTTMTGLLNQVETKIEAIMDLVRAIPGFMEKYPEYKDGEELSTIDVPKPEEPAKEAEEEKPADGEAPASEAPAAPAGEAAAPAE